MKDKDTVTVTVYKCFPHEEPEGTVMEAYEVAFKDFTVGQHTHTDIEAWAASVVAAGMPLTAQEFVKQYAAQQPIVLPEPEEEPVL